MEKKEKNHLEVGELIIVLLTSLIAYICTI
jgi:hypothetical protein